MLRCSHASVLHALHQRLHKEGWTAQLFVGQSPYATERDREAKRYERKRNNGQPDLAAIEHREAHHDADECRRESKEYLHHLHPHVIEEGHPFACIRVDVFARFEGDRGGPALGCRIDKEDSAGYGGCQDVHRINI
jgi:hypothetical protein